MSYVSEDCFATAFIFPRRINDIRGIVVARCTEEANLIQRCRMSNEGGMETILSACRLFECYFYEV